MAVKEVALPVRRPGPAPATSARNGFVASQTVERTFWQSARHLRPPAAATAVVVTTRLLGWLMSRLARSSTSSLAGRTTPMTIDARPATTLTR